MDAPQTTSFTNLPAEIWFSIFQFTAKLGTLRAVDKRMNALATLWLRDTNKALCNSNPRLKRYVSSDDELMRFKQLMSGLKHDGAVLKCGSNELTQSLDQGSSNCIHDNKFLLMRRNQENMIGFCKFIRDMGLEGAPVVPLPHQNLTAPFTEAKRVFEEFTNSTQLAALTVLSMEGDRFIPEEVNLLTALRELNLRQNTYVQTLPSLRLTSLTQLEWFMLDNLENLPSIEPCVQLTRLSFYNLPKIKSLTACEHLTNLRHLRLELPKLESIPECFINFALLQCLHFSEMPMINCWPVVVRMAQLQDLTISHYNVGPIPETISQLTNLQTLDMMYCQLSALPNGIGHLGNLISLCLGRGNSIAQLPETCSGLTSLQELKLSENALTEFPNIRGLTALRTLVLKENQIRRVPDYLTALTQLVRVDLRDNPISEEDIPEALKSNPVFSFGE